MEEICGRDGALIEERKSIGDHVHLTNITNGRLVDATSGFYNFTLKIEPFYT